MKTIDIHAHLVPRSLWQAVEAGREWHGFRHEPGDGIGAMLGGGRRTSFSSPKVRFTPEERLKDMDAQGVDVQVVSIHTPFFGYHLDSAQGRALAREVNDEISAMTRQWPQRFAGLATLPVQDVKAAIDELERAVTVLGLKGAELDTAVNGENWDEAKFRPLFKAAEAMGSVLFFHPQPQHNFMMQRTTRYGLSNSLGVILDDAIVVAMLIFGGVLEACPKLKVCIAHGGGPACYAMGRMDRGWQGTPEASSRRQVTPSSTLSATGTPGSVPCRTTICAQAPRRAAVTAPLIRASAAPPPAAVSFSARQHVGTDATRPNNSCWSPITRKSLITSAPSAIAHAKSASTWPRSYTSTRSLASAFGRAAVSPVLSASARSSASPACDTIPVPPTVTSSPFSQPVAFTLRVLLDLGRYGSRHPNRPRSGALFYVDAPVSHGHHELPGLRRRTS